MNLGTIPLSHGSVTARHVTATFVFVSLLGGVPLWAQGFPQRGVEIIQALYLANPQNDDERRVAIVKVCEQMKHDLGDQWGNKKRAGLSDAFLSPDSIAFLEADLSVSVWDVQASSGQILVHAGKLADHPRLPASEATFMPCRAVNHMGSTPPPDPDPVPDPEFERRLTVLETTFRATEAELRAILAMLTDLVNGLDQRAGVDRRRIEALEARPMPFQGCRAAIAGIPISCRLQ